MQKWLDDNKNVPEAEAGEDDNANEGGDNANEGDDNANEGDNNA
jgi:hypothetical protein